MDEATLLFVLGLALIGLCWWRLEVGSVRERDVLLWLVAAAVPVAAITAVLVFADADRARGVHPAILAGLTLLLLAALLVGLLRPNLVDVRALLVSAVVAVVVVTAYIAAFVGLWSLLSLLGAGTLTPATFALIGVVCAGGVHPLRVLLRGVVDRLLFGDRPDPLRAGDLRLSAADEQVLRVVAPLLAQTVRLRASREAAVAGIEDERRRLRRDLHDGLGPTLTGVAYAADAARNLLFTDPGAADQQLASVRTSTEHAINEIRRLVDGLRPPALDELGLVAALRQHASHLMASTKPALAGLVPVAAGRSALLSSDLAGLAADRAPAGREEAKPLLG